MTDVYIESARRDRCMQDFVRLAESLGVRLTAIIIGIMLIANLANTVSEFAGVAASLEIFGVSKYLSVPVAAATGVLHNGARHRQQSRPRT